MTEQPSARKGQVLCCGRVPKIGYHNHHEYDGQTGLRAYGCYCPVCGKHSSIIGEGVDFAIHHFNRIVEREQRGTRRLDGTEIMPINAPEGYRWGSIRIDNTFMGGKHSVDSCFILFHTKHDDLVGVKRDREYWIDAERQLKNLKLMNSVGIQEDLDWFVKARMCSGHVSESWCTDGAAWYNVNLSLVGAAMKHVIHLNQQLTNLGIKNIS